MSVLEVHHCNLSIEVLSDPETNVFHSLSPDQRTYAFKMLVNIILATDMPTPPPWADRCWGWGSGFRKARHPIGSRPSGSEWPAGGRGAASGK